MSIRGRIVSALFCLLLLMAGAVAFAFSELRKIGWEIEQISLSDIPTLLECESIARGNLEQALNFERALRYAAQGDPTNSAPIKEARREFQKLSSLITGSFTNLSEVLALVAIDQTDEFSPLRQLKKIQSAYDSYEKRANEILLLLEQGNLKEAKLKTLTIGVEESALQGEIKDLLERIQSRTTSSSLQAASVQSSALRGVLLLSVGALGVGLVMAIIITRSITGPLKTAVSIANEIANGKENVMINIPKQPELAMLMTALKEMHEAVRRSQSQLEERNADLARSNTELEQFAYIASHDLQEPLRMVTSYVQLLGKRYRGKLDKSADEYIAFAVDGTARMKLLINDLLAYSRVGRADFLPEMVNSNEVMHRVLLNLEPLMRDKNATVTFDPLPTVPAEEIQLSQVLQNLVGNAIKFHGEHPPKVHVSASKEGDFWRFSVKDNGIGIDQSFTERIFQIFQRLHKGGEYPGTGIGLAICKKIVERFGGAISVHSEVGKGSTFYFTIPIEQRKGES